MVKFSKRFSLLCALVAVTALVFAPCASAWDGSAASPDKVGEWYEISTAEQFAGMAKMVSEDYAAYGATKYRLTADIDLAGHDWTPIGGLSLSVTVGTPFVDAKPFNGEFDGQGHSVSGFTVNVKGNNTSAYWYGGLFATVSDDGKISNVALSDFDVTVSGDVLSTYAGGLVGYSFGKITACTAEGTVTAGGTKSDNTTAATNAGGLVGWNYGAITASFAACETQGTSRVGGLVGLNYGAITASFAAGATKGTSNVGGLVGMNGGSIAASFAAGAAEVNYDSGSISVGGLVGSNVGNITFSGASCTAASASASTSTSSPSSAGGLVGIDDGIITASYATGDATAAGGGESRAGGLVGAQNSGSVTTAYATGSAKASGAPTANISGGLIGKSYAKTIASYATGTATANGTLPKAGGLVGWNVLYVQSWPGGSIIKGEIQTSYSVDGSSAVASDDNTGETDVTPIALSDFADASKLGKFNFTTDWCHTDLDGGALPRLLVFFTADKTDGKHNVISPDMVALFPKGIIAVASDDKAEMFFLPLHYEVKTLALEPAVEGVHVSLSTESPYALVISTDAYTGAHSGDIALVYTVSGDKSGTQQKKTFTLVVTENAKPTPPPPPAPEDIEIIDIPDDVLEVLPEGTVVISSADFADHGASSDIAVSSFTNDDTENTVKAIAASRSFDVDLSYLGDSPEPAAMAVGFAFDDGNFGSLASQATEDEKVEYLTSNDYAIVYDYVDTADAPAGWTLPANRILVGDTANGAKWSWEYAVDEGFVVLSGDQLITRYIIVNQSGSQEPYKAGGFMAIPDGLFNTRLHDPIWAATVEPKQTDPDNPTGGGSGVGCGTGAAGIFALLSLVLVLRRGRR